MASSSVITQLVSPFRGRIPYSIIGVIISFGDSSRCYGHMPWVPLALSKRLYEIEKRQACHLVLFVGSYPGMILYSRCRVVNRMRPMVSKLKIVKLTIQIGDIGDWVGGWLDASRCLPFIYVKHLVVYFKFHRISEIVMLTAKLPLLQNITVVDDTGGGHYSDYRKELPKQQWRKDGKPVRINGAFPKPCTICEEVCVMPIKCYGDDCLYIKHKISICHKCTAEDHRRCTSITRSTAGGIAIPCGNVVHYGCDPETNERIRMSPTYKVICKSCKLKHSLKS